MDLFQIIGLQGDPSDEDEDWDSDFEGEDSDWTDSEEDTEENTDHRELTCPGTKPFVYSYCYQILRIPTSSVHFQVADALNIWHPPPTAAPSHRRLAAIAPSDGASALHVWNLPSTSTIDKFADFVPGQSSAAPTWLGGVQLLSDEVYSTAFSDDGNHLFVGCDHGLLTLCQVNENLPSLPRYLDVGNITLPIDPNSLNEGWHGSRRPTSWMFNIAGYKYCYPPVLEIERQEETQQLGEVLKGRWMDYKAFETLHTLDEEHWHIGQGSAGTIVYHELMQLNLASDKCVAVKCALHAMGGKGTMEALEAYLNEHMGITLEMRIIIDCEHQLPPLSEEFRSRYEGRVFEGIKKQDSMYCLQKEGIAPAKGTTSANNNSEKKKRGRGRDLEEGEPSAAVAAAADTVPAMDYESLHKILGILFLKFKEHLASPATAAAASKDGWPYLRKEQRKKRIQQKEKEEAEAASVGLTLEYLSLLCRNPVFGYDFISINVQKPLLVFLKDLVLSRPDLYTLSSPEEGFPLRVLPRNFPWLDDKWEADHNIQHAAAVSPVGHFILGYPTAEEIQLNMDLVEEHRPDGCYRNRVLVWPESMVNGVSVGSVGGVRRMLAAEQSGYIYIFDMPRMERDENNNNNNNNIMASCMCESLGEEGKKEEGKVGWVKRPVLSTELRPNYIDSDSDSDSEDEDDGAHAPPPCLHHEIKSTAAIGPFGFAINNAQCSPDGRWIAVVADGPSVFLVDQMNGFTWEKVPLHLNTNGLPGDVALGRAVQPARVDDPVDPGHYGSFYCAWNASSTLFAGSIAAGNRNEGSDGDLIAPDNKIVVWEIMKEGSSTTTTGPPLSSSSSQPIEMETNSSCRVAAIITNHIGPVLPVKFAPWDDRVVIYAEKKAFVHFARIPENKDCYHDDKRALQPQQQEEEEEREEREEESLLATGVESMQTVAIKPYDRQLLRHKDSTILDDGFHLHGRQRITGLEVTEEGDILVSSRQMLVHRFLANGNSYEWTIDRHKSWPESFQAAVRTLLLCHKRAGAEGFGMLSDLVLLNVIKMAAIHRCDWVSFELGAMRE